MGRDIGETSVILKREALNDRYDRAHALWSACAGCPLADKREENF